MEMSVNIQNIFQRTDDTKGHCRIQSSRMLRIGIIGTGWIARAHMTSYLAMDDVKIAAAADLVPGKARNFLDQFGLTAARAYEDPVRMFESEALDAVSICTSNTSHAECAISALIHGVNVMLEKPMAVTLEEAAEVCRAEKRSGKLLSVGFQPRYEPNMQKICSIVSSGALGDIYYIQTGGGRRRGIPTAYGTSFIKKETAGIGALGDIGCYSLDMVLNAIGYPKPLTVTGYLSSFFGRNADYYPDHPEYASIFGVDDFAAAFIRLEGNIILDFRIAWAMNIDSPCDTIILGTKGGLRIPSTDCWNGGIGGPLKLYHEVAGSQVETEFPVLCPAGPTLFDQKIRAFIEAIITDGPAPVPSSQILYNQAIIDGIVKSAEQGREIQIEIPEI